MTQQDQTPKCSNSSSAGTGGSSIGGLGKSSKKPKQNKVPQRGLGVAQLEKIRIEEQQRKEAAAVAAILPNPPSSLSPSKSAFLPLPHPSFHHSNQPSSSPISSHPGTPVDFTRLPLSLQNTDAAKASSCTVSLTNSGNFESSWHSIGQGNVPKLCDFEKDFLPSMSKSLSYESNPTWPPSNWTQRTQQYQQPPSLMVNVSSGNLVSPGYHYSKEPPSNQNCSSSCVPMRQEEKMMGLKRSYPFSLDIPPASSFNFKLPAFTTYVKANGTTSCAYGTGLNFGAANSTFREIPSCSTSNTEPNTEPNSERTKETENFDGDFLTLAPPTSTSKFMSTSTSPTFQNQEFPHFGSPAFQGTEEDEIPHGQGHNQFNLQQHQSLHSFFPPKESQTVQTTKTGRDENCNGGKVESVDLNLKL